MALPPVVEAFLQQVKMVPQYIFLVVTMGAMSGQALGQGKELLKQRELRLSYGAQVALPDNSIVFPSPQARQEKLLRNAAGMWVLDKIKQFGKLSCADDKCVGCGICAEVCPAGNITMAAGKPAFGSECVHCFGCAHWCPQNAISLGRLKPDQKTRYKHPEITSAELAVQKERKDEI